MSRTGPQLSVIVCTFNRAALLSGCLASLADQTLDQHLFEVVVVDNNSTDATGEVAARAAAVIPQLRLVKEKNQGLSHARNRGWREARGEFVAYLDDDAKATPEWCERVLRAFREVQPRPAAVGGEIRPFFETPPPDWFCDELEVRSWGSEAGFLQPPRARYGFSGSNMAFPLETLRALGGFSTELGMVGGKLRLGEETEFFSRLYRQEQSFWYDPQITVLHWVPRENLRLGYRFRRAFKSGSSEARIEGRKSGALDYLEAVPNIGGFLLRTLFALPRSGGNRGQRAVLALQELGGRLGYFFGR